MNQFYKYLFPILFFFQSGFSQNDEAKHIDSIKAELGKAKHDTTRIKIFLALAENIFDPDEWPKYNQKSIDLSEKLISSTDSSIRKIATHALANGLNNKGYYFNSVGRYDSAMYFYLRSTELMLKTKDKEGSAIVLMNIGLLLNNKGDYVGSIDYYYKSLRIFESIDNAEGISQVLNNLASVYNFVNDKKRAKEYYYKSIEIKKKLNNPVLLSNGYNNLGSFYDKSHVYDSARYYYNKALIIKRKYRDMHGIMNLYNNIGSMYLDQDKYDSSGIYLNKALDMALKNNSKDGLAYSYNNLANLNFRQKKYKQAEDFVKQSLAISDQNKLIKPTISSYGILSNIYKSTKNFEKALFYSGRFQKMTDSLINNDKQRSIAVLQIKHDYEKEMFADSLNRIQQERVNQLKHQAEIQRQKVFTYVGIAVAVFMFLFALLLLNRYRIKQRTNRLLEEKNQIIVSQKEKVQLQKELLEKKNNEVMDSINYAQRIQKSLLSSDKLLSRNLKEYFVLFKPKDIVSGDFYWASETKEGFIVVNGDCTGHGVPGAFMSVLMISKLSEVIKEKNITRPDLILNQLRSEVISSLNPSDSNEITRDGMDAVVCKFDFKSMKLEFAAANNTFYIVKNGELIIAKPDKMPVGKSDSDTTPFTYNEVSLAGGDMIYTFTDGYADQFGGPKGKKFKYKQLCELLLKISQHPLNEQYVKLNNEFENWKGQLEQIDDVCVIGIRV